MAAILPDRDVKKLIGSVIADADPNLVNPNGIELRLGKQVLFHSTDEERELTSGQFLKVSPGESISISSRELIDFRSTKVQELFPDCTLMAFITPTTTMMREGISQAATKIDVGFHGVLNWGLRNSSTKDLILQYGEPVFKLTIFALDEHESPEIAYGDRPKDSYQGSEGIVRSARRIPANIPKTRIVSSTFDNLDPKKQLREAGYPFDHIGTELTNLDGKFEVVSSDVRMMRDEFHRTTQELSSTFSSETKRLSDKIEDTRRSLMGTVESLLERKFIRLAGGIVGVLTMLYGGVTYLQETRVGQATITLIAVVVGFLIILISYTLTKRAK